MSARTHPNLNLLKKMKEDHPPPPEPKIIHKRKRLGEIYITTDKQDRLTLQSTSFQTYSDEEVALESQCFGHLPCRSGPRVHLCWQFDDTQSGEEKSAELIKAISKVVKILKSLDADEDEFPGTACNSQLKNGATVTNGHVNGVPAGDHAHETKVPLQEPEKDTDMGEEDWELKRRENFMSRELARSRRKISRRKHKAYKGSARFEETRFNRRAADSEPVCPSKGFEASEPRVCLLSTHDSELQGPGSTKSGHEPADVDQPEGVMPLHERSGQQAPKDEDLSPESTHALVTSVSHKELELEPESGCESEGEYSDCQIVDFDADSPPGLKKLKPNDAKYDYCEEMNNKVILLPDKQGFEEVQHENTFDPKISCSEFEVKEDCSVCEEDKCAGSKHSALDDIKRENMGSFTSDLEVKLPVKRRGEYSLRTESTRDSSPDSSEDSLLYEDEQMFHDSVRELKGKNTKSHELFTMKLGSGVDSFETSRPDNDSNARDSENRQEKPRRRIRIRYEIRTLPEVDKVFSGPKWKTFDQRVRVKTILDQFHFLLEYFRSEASMKDKVKNCRMRPDIQAGKYLMAKRFCFNEGLSVIGNVPGVEVGDMFAYREELLILIVHRTSQAGIEYIPAQKSGFVDRDGHPLAVAVSVVSSGGYKDNEDDGETLTYVGSGGEKNLTHSRSSAAEKDQELVRGNLALKNSCDLGVPVRVVRGEKYMDGDASKKSYWYDGLYNVMKYYEEIGSAGSKVWKFRLVKQKGQRQA